MHLLIPQHFKKLLTFVREQLLKFGFEYEFVYVLEIRCHECRRMSNAFCNCLVLQGKRV